MDGRLDEALLCFKKSARILENASDSNVLINLGWAASWIGQVLEKQQRFEAAYVAFRRAAMKWKIPSPPRAKKAMEDAIRMRSKLPGNANIPADDWECNRSYLDWLIKD
jgi:tetratricopeptide (TPR) repeat protein